MGVTTPQETTGQPATAPAAPEWPPTIEDRLGKLEKQATTDDGRLAKLEAAAGNTTLETKFNALVAQLHTNGIHFVAPAATATTEEAAS